MTTLINENMRSRTCNGVEHVPPVPSVWPDWLVEWQEKNSVDDQHEEKNNYPRIADESVIENYQPPTNEERLAFCESQGVPATFENGQLKIEFPPEWTTDQCVEFWGAIENPNRPPPRDTPAGTNKPTPTDS